MFGANRRTGCGGEAERCLRSTGHAVGLQSAVAAEGWRARIGSRSGRRCSQVGSAVPKAGRFDPHLATPFWPLIPIPFSNSGCLNNLSEEVHSVIADPIRKPDARNRASRVQAGMSHLRHAADLVMPCNPLWSKVSFDPWFDGIPRPRLFWWIRHDGSRVLSHLSGRPKAVHTDRLRTVSDQPRAPPVNTA
jgi:hypothetical protein